MSLVFLPRTFCLLPLAMSFVWSCTKTESDTASATQGGTLSTVSLPNQLVIENEALGLIRNAKLLGNSNPERVAQGLMTQNVTPVFGNSLADGISALKYRISNLELCGKTDGSRGDACTERPFSLYREPGTGDYDTFVPGSAAVSAFTGWTDFIKKGSLEDLIGKVTYTDTQVGTYEAVIVNFYRSFKVNAEVILSDGAKVYTKNVSEFYDNGKTGLDITYAGKSPTMTTAPAEDGVFFLPNGGKTFLLQRPFEITEDDMKNLVPYKMALAFDHANFVKGSPWSAEGRTDFLDGQVDDANGYKISPSFLEFAPILARESETIMKETYILSTNGIPGTDTSLGDQPFSARVTFYYVKEDADQSIRAVTSMAYYNEYSKGYLNYNPVGGISKIKDGTTAGTIDVMQGAGGVITLFKNFKRLSTVGDSGTLTGEACSSSVTSTGCSVAVKTVDWVYTFVGASEAETELSIKAVTPPPPPAETP